MDNFLFDFYYNIIDKIITYINITDKLNVNLNYSYCESNNDNKIEQSSKKVPIIFCLGGMAYKMYEKIFIDNQLNIQLDSDTYDYDFSFSLNNNSEDTILLFENNMDNYEVVIRRKELWYYINELKNDKIMKKFVIWN
jgi:hypothetical protein